MKIEDGTELHANDRKGSTEVQERQSENVHIPRDCGSSTNFSSVP
jgi:hypothetical protein